MKVTVIQIVISTLGGRRELEIRRQILTSQTTALSWRLEETCCHSASSGKPSVNAKYLRFLDTNGSPNLGQATRPSDSQQKIKERACRIVAFNVPADYRIKLKESENWDKYIDLARELKKYGT